jgi:hypothetical protein
MSSQERSRRLGEAMEAARSAARGMSCDEARGRIVAELRAHGIMLPPPSVDLILYDVMLGTGVAGRARRAAWHLGNAADLAGYAIRFLSAAARRQPLPRWDLGGVRSLKWDPHVRAEVILDANAQESIAIGASDETDDGIMEVWLDCPGSRRGLRVLPAALAASQVSRGMSPLWSTTGRNVSAFWDWRPVTLTARRFVRPTTRASYR